jgi:hypothetical protein
MHFARLFVLRCGVLGTLIVGFLGVDSILGSPADLINPLALGIFVGQVSLIAAWVALARQNVILRASSSLVLGMMMWYALILGNRGSGMASSLSRGQLVLLGAFFLAGIAVAQIPLWISRKLFGWRLASGDTVDLPWTQGRLQFNMQPMLVATALVSIAMAPLRTILPPEDVEPSGFGGELCLEFTLAAISGLMLTTPCIRAAMCRASRLIPIGFMGFVYCGVITALVLGMYVAIVGSISLDEYLGRCLLFFMVNVSQCVTVFGTLLLFRALGLRLVRRPSDPMRASAAASLVSRLTDVESAETKPGNQGNP